MSIKQNEWLVAGLQTLDLQLVEEFELVKNWVHGILPNENIVLDSDESKISGANGTITVESGVVPVKHIGGTRERPGFVVIRWSPDDEWNGTCIGQSVTLVGALKHFIRALFEEKLERYLGDNHE